MLHHSKLGSMHERRCVTSTPATRWKVLGGALLAVLAVLALYLLSIGPLLRWHSQLSGSWSRYADRVLATFYGPAFWFAERQGVASAGYRAYLSEWHGGIVVQPDQIEVADD